MMGGMKLQNLIKQTLSRPESVLTVQQILEGNTESHRSAIAGLVCEHFKFFSALGKPQIAGCLKALGELERFGKLELPLAQARAPKPEPKRLKAPVEAPLTLPSSAGQIQSLELILVESDAQTRVWNELMIQDHPRGAGPLFWCPDSLPDPFGAWLAGRVGFQRIRPASQRQGPMDRLGPTNTYAASGSRY